MPVYSSELQPSVSSWSQEAKALGLNWVLIRKNLTMDVQSQQEFLLSQVSDPLAKELADKKAQLAKLIQSRSQSQSIAEFIETTESHRSRIEGLLDNIERLERQLIAKSPAKKEDASLPAISVSRLASLLPRNSALIEFVKVKDFYWSEGIPSSYWRYLAFILQASGKVDLVDLGEDYKLEWEIENALKELLSGTYSEPGPQIKVASRLYKIIWQPLIEAMGANALEQVTTLVISPDGILNFVPFAALRNPAGRFLLEDHTIVYVTSGRDFFQQRRDIHNELDLAAVINPAFDQVPKLSQGEQGSTSKSAAAVMPFIKLTGTEEEEFLRKLIPGGKNEFLPDEKATKDAVLKIHSPKILHLSTHGFFWPPPKSVEVLLLRTGQKFNPTKPTDYDNPLHRAGLALAGANYASKDNPNNGLLTAYEISGMNLRGTELVVLSACDTGLGEARSGDGVTGLRRAFFLAGAHHVVMSLWQVDGQIALKQLQIFYHYYLTAMPPAQALKKAQLQTIERFRKAYGEAAPSIWAPFIVQSAGTIN